METIIVCAYREYSYGIIVIGGFSFKCYSAFHMFEQFFLLKGKDVK